MDMGYGWIHALSMGRKCKCVAYFNTYVEVHSTAYIALYISTQ